MTYSATIPDLAPETRDFDYVYPVEPDPDGGWRVRGGAGGSGRAPGGSTLVSKENALAVTGCGRRLTMTVVFLLVSGASGAGKSTARRLAAGELEPEVECVELHDVVPMPRVPTLVWRQRATEAVVGHALQLQQHGRHLLLAGDPVAAGEVLAAPSADRLDGIAVCMLDVDRDAQAGRLLARGDDPALLVHHVAFADWMRGHAADPHHRPEVLQTDGWEQMRWERWSRSDDTGSWAMHVLDTSSLTAEAVASELLAWCRRALAGQAPAMRVRA